MGKRGGAAIATGSDGCVFDGTFAPDGTFTKDTTGAVVTKVYTGKEFEEIAQNEYEMMERVREATGGVGVVVASSPPTPIATITEQAWEQRTELKGRAACKRIVDNPGGPFIGLVSPRITGTLLDLKTKQKTPVTADAFNELEGAVLDMYSNKLVHMDFAARNIFYSGTDDEPTLLLGDFGNTISLDDENFDAAITNYIEKYRIGGIFLASVKIDGVTPFAVAMMIGYHALLKGKDYYTAFITSIRDNKLEEKLTSIAMSSWLYRVVQNKSGAGKEDMNGLFTFERYIEKQFGMIIKIFAGDDKTYEQIIAFKDSLRSALKAQLRESDKRMLGVMKYLYTVEYLIASDFDVLSQLWFPKLYGKLDLPPQGGGRKQTKGGSQTVMFDSLEAAIAQPDPILKPGNNVSIGDVSLESIGGKRKTRRRRLNRVKTVRRINGRIGVRR